MFYLLPCNFSVLLLYSGLLWQNGWLLDSECRIQLLTCTIFTSRMNSILYSILTNYLDRFHHNTLKFPSKLADGFSITFWIINTFANKIANIFVIFLVNEQTTKKSKQKTQNHLNCWDRKSENRNSQFFKPDMSILISS